jgi:hypothetical protein
LLLLVAVAREDWKSAQATQVDFPHRVVVSDAERGLSEAVDLLAASDAKILTE